MTAQQLDSTGRLRHLLTLEGMPRPVLESLLDQAQACHDSAIGRDQQRREVLAGRAVCTLFFEPSTRTRSSFTLAAQRLGADVMSFDASTSSARKGETDTDTLRNLEAMGIRGFVIRHPDDGAVARLAAAVAPDTCLLNAGDGRSGHPTQGLLDMLTIRQAKGTDFSRLKVMIVGDVKHSRVARTDLHALRTLGTGEIRVCGPANLLPDDDTLAGCTVGDDLDAMIQGVDVLMMLRLQHERMSEGLVPSLEQYHAQFGLDARRLAMAAPEAIVMHPGPINRGVEVTDEVADGEQSWILRQVANGVAVRMAALQAVLG